MSIQNIIIKKETLDKNFELTSKKFNELHGYYSKCISCPINKSNVINQPNVLGYIVRCEVPNYPEYTSIIYEPIVDNNGFRRDLKTVKYIAMERCIKSGERFLNKLKKENKLEEFNGNSIEDMFTNPQNLNETEKFFFSNTNFNYEEFFNYIQNFGNKVKKYYKDKNVKIIWIKR
jgi:hypothetical protein